jgi:hypothetical protein
MALPSRRRSASRVTHRDATTVRYPLPSEAGAWYFAEAPIGDGG